MTSTRTWNVRRGITPVETQGDLIGALLALRGVSPAMQEAFFAPTYGNSIHNPMGIFDMEKAVSRVMGAIKKKERIMVYGDYDADGICSTAIMVSTLTDIGAHVFPFLPHRYDDGYGLSSDALSAMKSEFDVLITVDCGISNAAEVALLRDAGKDTIIVDHHELPETLPAAYAILHPRHPKGSYAWGHLCGAGVSWKFAQALLRHAHSPYASDPDKEKWLLDLAMIGTIGDVMPLLGENRAIVHFGRQVLPITKKLGLAALVKESHINLANIQAEDIAFRIVPLLNAAGRMGHPQSALNALLAITPEQAMAAVQELVGLNEDRRSVSRDILKYAEDQVDHSLPFVFLANQEWPAGIVGLVAGRLASKFGKPAFILGGIPGKKTHAVGSARGNGKSNVLTALETVRHHTVKLGGHAAAAGFSVLPEKLEAIKEGLREYFTSQDSSAAPSTQVADAVVSANLVSWELAHALAKFAPFGEANPNPSFVMKGLRVFETRTVGKSNDHLKARLLVGDTLVEGIGFGLGKQAEGLSETVDVIASVGVNEFKGRENLELRIHDIAPAGTVEIIGL